jgi:hypothetical protein
MRSLFTACFSCLMLLGCQSSLSPYEPDADADDEDAQADGADTAPDAVDVAADDGHPHETVDVIPDLPVDIVPDEAPADIVPDDLPVDITPDDVPVDIVPDDLPVDVVPDDAPVDVVPDDAPDTPPDIPVDIPVDEAPVDVVPDDAIDADIVIDDMPPERPEICGNGIDDDGDGRIDCMDGDCLLDAGCAGTCYPLSTITCGSTFSSSNMVEGATDRIVQASCVTWDSWTGPEVAYRLDLADTRLVTLTLNGLAADLDLFLLDDTGDRCDAGNCLARSIAATTDPETITETLTAGTYFILVDGYMDATGPFTLGLSCQIPEICNNGVDDNGDGLADCADPQCAGRPPCVPACTPAETVVCGSILSGSTAAAGATDVNTDYSCGGYSETGPEFTYAFTAAGGGSVTFTIDTLSTTLLDLFVLEDTGTGCDPFTCIGQSTTDDPSDAVTITARPGAVYYVVVDCYADSMGTYRLSVTCP